MDDPCRVGVYYDHTLIIYILILYHINDHYYYKLLDQAFTKGIAEHLSIRVKHLFSSLLLEYVFTYYNSYYAIEQGRTESIVWIYRALGCTVS